MDPIYDTKKTYSFLRNKKIWNVQDPPKENHASYESHKGYLDKWSCTMSPEEILQNPKDVIFPFPHGAVVKNLPVSAGEAKGIGSIPGSWRSPGGGNGNSLQYSCLENSMGRGTRQATAHGVAKSQTQLSTHSIQCLVTLSIFSCGFWYLHNFFFF